MRTPTVRPRHRFLLAAAVALTSCGGGGSEGGGGGITTPSSVELALSGGTLTVAQGASGTVTATISRANFTGDVQLTVENAPAGITASLSASTLSSGVTQSTVTIAAGTAAVAGNTTLTVRARGTGVSDKTASLVLTVTQSAGAFTLSMVDASVSAQQNQSAATGVAIGRTNFTAPVTLALSGPTGVTASFSANPATGAGATLVIGAGTLPVGTYVLTIRGTAAGVPEVTTSVSLTVTAPGPSTSVSFTLCSSVQPLWVGYQNGGGPWTTVTAAGGNSYNFTLTGPGAIATVQAAGGDATVNGYQTDVLYASAAELKSLGAHACAAAGTKTVTGTVAGVGSADLSLIDLGSASSGASLSSPAFTLTQVDEGEHDLVAVNGVNGATGYAGSKLIVRRAINPATGTALPVLDFSAAEAVATTTPALTLPGVGNVSLLVGTSVITANGTRPLLQFAQMTTTTAKYVALPAATKLTSDLYDMLVLTDEGTSERGAVSFFTSGTDHTVVLGPLISQPTVTSVSSYPYPRLRAQLPAQSAYGALVDAEFLQQSSFQGADDRVVTMDITAAYLGGTPVTWASTVPDFSTATGFNATWVLRPIVATAYTVTAYSDNVLTTTTLTDGLTQLFSLTVGDGPVSLARVPFPGAMHVSTAALMASAKRLQRESPFRTHGARR